MISDSVIDPGVKTCVVPLRDWQFHVALVAAIPVWLAGDMWLSPDTRWDWPLQFPRELLVLGVLYPLIEEILFRGLLQTWLLERPNLRRRWLGLSGANWFVSVVFAGLHFISHPPLAAVAVLVPSLIFGHFRERHRSLCAPIALHVFYNVGYFWIFSG